MNNRRFQAFANNYIGITANINDTAQCLSTQLYKGKELTPEQESHLKDLRTWGETAKVGDEFTAPDFHVIVRSQEELHQAAQDYAERMHLPH